MQDFATPFNPLGGTPITVNTPDGKTTTLQPGCCGSVCSPSCIVEERPVNTAQQTVGDDVLVTIQVPVGFRRHIPGTPGKPVFDPTAITEQNPQGQVGEDCSGEEVYEPFTITLGQLKGLALSRIFVVGNYADTQMIMGRIKRELSGDES